MAINPALFSSATDLHATPQAFFNKLNAEFGFVLDVCANAENAKCPYYFTQETNGLSQPWKGVVWCNPPYGREIGEWVKKAYESSREGATVVMLLPARIDTRWFMDWVMGKAAEVRIVKGRLKFGSAKRVAPFPSIVVVFRPSLPAGTWVRNTVFSTIDRT